MASPISTQDRLHTDTDTNTTTKSTTYSDVHNSTTTANTTRSDFLLRSLEQAHEKYTDLHPHSKAHHLEASKYLPGGNTRTVLHTTPFPLTIASARDCYLTTVDDDGVETTNHKRVDSGTTQPKSSYIDFLGEYTAGIYGHSHPVIKKAVQTALDGGWNYGGQNRLEAQLAARVCARFPAIEMVRFVNSGTEANMMALATAVAYTGKNGVVVFKKGYHGSTISGKPSPINLPHAFTFATYNDIPGTESLIRSLPKDSLAAILVEPMLGSGGCYSATPEFLGSLRRLADASNALLIFDEVMTSRLHYHGLGSHLAAPDVKPDLMTLGKWVGGGMSFGAFGGRREIMALYDPRSGKLEHPGTFNNNVFSMHAGIAGCDLLTAERLDGLNDLGDAMRTKIESVLEGVGQGCTVPTRPILEDSNFNVDDTSSASGGGFGFDSTSTATSRPPKMFIKGVGSLMTIQFAGPDKDVLQGLFFHHMLDSGIYLAQRGFVALSIMITDEHVELFVRAVRVFVNQYEAFLKW